MSKRLQHWLKNQPQVKVAQQTQNADEFRFATLAFFFAGVFYFFTYYFWGTAWSVLTGG